MRCTANSKKVRATANIGELAGWKRSGFRHKYVNQCIVSFVRACWFCCKKRASEWPKILERERGPVRSRIAYRLRIL